MKTQTNKQTWGEATEMFLPPQSLLAPRCWQLCIQKRSRLSSRAWTEAEGRATGSCSWTVGHCPGPGGGQSRRLEVEPAGQSLRLTDGGASTGQTQRARRKETDSMMYSDGWKDESDPVQMAQDSIVVYLYSKGTYWALWCIKIFVFCLYVLLHPSKSFCFLLQQNTNPKSLNYFNRNAYLLLNKKI